MTTTARQIAKDLTVEDLLVPLPDGVYGTFVMVDGVRHDRCRAQVEAGSFLDRDLGRFTRMAVCANPADGGRFCGAHR